jgi:hypothetical protein
MHAHNVLAKLAASAITLDHTLAAPPLVVVVDFDGELVNVAFEFVVVGFEILIVIVVLDDIFAEVVIMVFAGVVEVFEESFVVVFAFFRLANVLRVLVTTGRG